MKTLSVTNVARHFSDVIDSIERTREEIVLVRNKKRVARLIPEMEPQTALEVFGDLYRTLDDKTAEAWASAIAKSKRHGGRLTELRNPWVG